jgi:hypothetical protein
MKNLFNTIVRGLAGQTVIALSLVGTVIGVGGCSSTGDLAGVQGVEANSGWLELRGNRFAEVAPGIVLEMPEGPYRARFSDTQGIYYQAARPLVYRSALGVVTAVTGGVYVKNGRLDRARSWSEPVMPSPRMAYSHIFAVKVHPAM